MSNKNVSCAKIRLKKRLGQGLKVGMDLSQLRGSRQAGDSVPARSGRNEVPDRAGQVTLGVVGTRSIDLILR